MPKSTKAAVAQTERPSSSKRAAGSVERAGRSRSDGGARAGGSRPGTKPSARSAAKGASGSKARTPKVSTKAAAAAESRGSGRRSGAKAPAATLDRFLTDQRALLEAERDASLHQAEVLRAEAEQLAEEMEPGDTQFDEESGEGGTLNVERERDLALSAQARSAVEEIDRALAKIEAGTYGTCEQCGQPIPKARLKALPYATLCVACKSGGLSRR